MISYWFSEIEIKKAHENHIKGEMYVEKSFALQKKLIYFLEEFTCIFLPSEIKVSFLKPQKRVFFLTYEVPSSVNVWVSKTCDVIWE